MDYHQGIHEKDQDSPKSNGTKDAQHTIKGQNKMHRDKGENKSDRHREIHLKNEGQMGGTHSTTKGQQMDHQDYGLDT